MTAIVEPRWSRDGRAALRALALGWAIPVLLALPAGAAARPSVIRDGPARFEVITPSLVRAEYASDKRFENRPTMTAVRSGKKSPRVTSEVRGGWRIIQTSQLTLRWRRGAGPFGAETLRVAFEGGGQEASAAPTPAGNSRPLGGWTRGLDLLSGPVPLHPGVLSRNGWYVLDDTNTVLLTSKEPGFAARPQREGSYRDWYLFAYGRDYTRALRDLRALTGPAPLLPRRAFGVWFSKYFPYSAAEFQDIAREFRSHGIPLTALSLDTDAKRQADPAGAALAAAAAGAPGRPYSWNGWDWNHDLFPDPRDFTDWAHRKGIDVGLNIHPSINNNDPRFEQTVAKTGRLATDDGICRLLQADPTGRCHVFDWTNPAQLDAYFDLHRPFSKGGIDSFWLDWCCEAPNSAVAPGLSPDTWINSRYSTRQRARGQRWPVVSRIGASFKPDGVYGDRGAAADGTGAFAEHRYTLHFTGDTCATWSMLAFEAELTAAEASIGMPYVSHDIGSFAGEPVLGVCNGLTAGQTNTVADDLYARWVQFGTFQPLDRLHSHHGKRLPWEYPGPAGDAAAKALRLRTALVPHLYTLARRSYDTGLPIAGPLYLQWPNRGAAYRHPTQYTFGDDIVVAPVTEPGDPASVTIWVPPGEWRDYFTHERYRGPAERTLSVPLSRLPVLVREGAIVPTASGSDGLELALFPSRRGRYELYEDEGAGFGYERDRFRRTAITHRRSQSHATTTIGPARGRYRGAPRTRVWNLTFLGLGAPRSVLVNGKRAAARNVDYEEKERTLTLATRSLPVRSPVTVEVRVAGRAAH